MPALPVIFMIVRGLGQPVNFGAAILVEFSRRRRRQVQMGRVRRNTSHTTKVRTVKTSADSTRCTTETQRYRPCACAQGEKSEHRHRVL